MNASELAFPAHKASLRLTHNEHKDVYLTVEQCIEERSFGYTDWVSEEQKQKAIDTDECWIVQWYPESPVGFCLLAAADLDVLLRAAREG